MSLNQNYTTQHTINARGRLISLQQPIVMGILNVTPDSFHHSSRIADQESALIRAAQMLEEGVSIIDVGAASSRPGASVISVEEELRRLIPIIEALLQKFPQAIFSIDTWRAEVAREALEAGAHVINDISAGMLEPDIISITADAHAPFIAMHMLGTPGKMPVNHEYADVAGDVLRFFATRIRQLREAGLTDIVMDPGFGFGKSVPQNFELLQRLEVFRFLEVPLMVGLSRKSMIWRTLDVSPEEALNGTTALHVIALQKGANILRVHDVKAAKEVIALYSRLLATGK